MGIEIEIPDANYHIRKVGDDSYSVTITDKKGEILSIDTWANEKNGKTISKKTLMDNLEKSGVQPSKDALKKL